MKLICYSCALFVLAGAVAAQVANEGAANATGRVIGEVTSVDAGTKKLALKSDKGEAVEVTLSDKSLYLRVPPGEKDLKKATRITLNDISAGDRVLARGAVSADQKSVAATSIIVMTRSDLAQMHQRAADEWQKRGLSGMVDSIDAAEKRFIIKTRTREGLKPIAVETSGKTEMFRYAPDSVKFSEAKPGAFTDIKVGDQVRVLGEKDADGTLVKAEQIVSGTFRQVAGQVVSINPAANEIKVTDLKTKQPLIVRINQDSSIRKLPPVVAVMLARRLNPSAEGGAAGGPGGAQGRPSGVAPEGSGMRAGAGPGGPGRPGGPGGPGGPRGDMQQMMERMPAITLTELKAGDDIIISSTTGAEPGRVTAISVIAGVEPLLRAAPERATSFGGWNFGEIGIPQ